MGYYSHFMLTDTTNGVKECPSPIVMENNSEWDMSHFYEDYLEATIKNNHKPETIKQTIDISAKYNRSFLLEITDDEDHNNSVQLEIANGELRAYKKKVFSFVDHEIPQNIKDIL
jgi:hypothetical protein